MDYQAPYGVSDPNAGYINGNPAQGIKGSIPPAQAIEYPQREIVNLIKKGGINPSNADLYQLTKGARRALYQFGVDTGSANSLSVALDPPLDAYGSGLEVRVIVAQDNTGASTIRINGLPTQQIVKKDGSQLYAGELRQGGIAVLVHDGTYFQLVSGTSNQTITGTGWYNGADWVVDVGTVNHIIGTPLIAPTAYAAGQEFAIYVKNRNTGPVDVNLNALGVHPLKLPTGQDLAIGDIMPNMTILVRYDGASFIMLSPIDRAIIQASANFIVGPNASPTPDFSDLYQALDWASRRRIARTGAIHLVMQGQATGSPVQHNYNAPITIAHPDGDRLYIEGAGMNFVPKRPNFVVNGSANANIAADMVTNVAMLRTAFQTEIHFTGTSGFQFDGTRANFKNLLISGPGAIANNCNGFYAYDCSTIYVDTVAVCNWSSCWAAYNSTTITGRNVYCVGAFLSGWNMSDSTSMSFGSGADPNTAFVVAQCYSWGIAAGNQAQINLATDADWPAIYGCYGGVSLYGSSTMNANKLFVYWVQYIGVYVTSSGSFRGDGGNISNAYQGFNVSVGSDANSPNWATANCAAGDFTASINSTIYAGGYTNAAAQFSPTKNTNGNGNSFIAA
jgi:hypothetical protein